MVTGPFIAGCNDFIPDPAKCFPGLCSFYKLAVYNANPAGQPFYTCGKDSCESAASLKI